MSDQAHASAATNTPVFRAAPQPLAYVPDREEREQGMDGQGPDRLPDQKVHQLIGWYHMMARVSTALHLLEPDARRRQVLLNESMKILREYRTGAQRLADWLRRQKPTRKGAKYQGCYDQISYIDGFGERTNCAELLHLGLPIGSGPNEGACKFLVAGRAKRSGQRWHEERLAAALTLRALHYSERFDPYWNVFKREYREIMRPAA